MSAGMGSRSGSTASPPPSQRGEVQGGEVRSQLGARAALVAGVRADAFSQQLVDHKGGARGTACRAVCMARERHCRAARRVGAAKMSAQRFLSLDRYSPKRARRRLARPLALDATRVLDPLQAASIAHRATSNSCTRLPCPGSAVGTTRLKDRQVCAFLFRRQGPKRKIQGKESGTRPGFAQYIVGTRLDTR